MSQSSPFGVILPARPILTNPLTLSPTQYTFTFPSSPAFTHIVIFLLPGITLPPSTLAAAYIRLPDSSDFQFLGAIGNEKQSAIFRVNNGRSGNNANGAAPGSGEDDMIDVDDPLTNGVLTNNDAGPQTGDITLGISLEPTSTVSALITTLRASKPLSSTSTALTISRPPPMTAITTKILAQRIIKNAFNFLASFAGTVGPGGEEVVPLRSFKAWWEKFERRVENDPGFLEREGDG